MKKKLKPLYVLALLFSLLGCSPSPEEIAFRASLIDKALNDQNGRAGKLFLEDNKLLEGVVTTASGLQYRVLNSAVESKPDTAAPKSARMTDKVIVKYEGRLITGEVFDSSYERNEPSEFPVNAVIRGWREVLLKMREGDHWRVFIPSHLAYGAKSPNALIAANSALIFDIELITIKGK